MNCSRARARSDAASRQRAAQQAGRKGLATIEIIVKIQRGQIMRKIEASSIAGFVRIAEKHGAAGSGKNSKK